MSKFQKPKNECGRGIPCSFQISEAYKNIKSHTKQNPSTKFNPQIEKGVDINIDGYLGEIKEFKSLYNFFATF